MNALFVAAKEIGDFMQKREWRFCLIGGLAVVRWGEMRTTLDVDLTLLTGFGKEESYIAPLLEHFDARIANALEFAIRNRVLLLRASNGKDVDISLGGLLFEEEMVRRATAFEFTPGLILPTCSAEDLFVMKVFAARGKDWQDAESIVVRQKLDTDYVFAHLIPLCELKEAPEIVEQARRLLERSQ